MGSAAGPHWGFVPRPHYRLAQWRRQLRVTGVRSLPQINQTSVVTNRLLLAPIETGVMALLRNVRLANDPESVGTE